MDQTNNKIYRFNFSNEFMSLLYNFAKLHEHEDRKTYKENWSKWTEENKQAILDEQNSLKEKGFTGNFQDKMYKSARYYFKRKNIFGERKKEKQGSRKNYLGLDIQLLGSMDEFMERKSCIEKPSESFKEFCENNSKEIESEKKRLEEDYNLKQEVIMEKIKKTYKNRYFQNINLKNNK